VTTVIKRVELFFQEGNSDKVYNASIVETAPGTYTVAVEWGRRGSALNKGNKAVGVSLEQAEKVYARLVREKTGKGYQEITGAVKPAAVAPPEGQGSGSKVQGRRKRTGVSAQLLEAIEESDLERHMKDDLMIAQQKIDGIRVLVHIAEQIIATNRSGEHTQIDRRILEGLSGMPHGTILDGEVIGGEYWLYDVLRIGDEDIRPIGYLDRWSRLEGDLEPGFAGPIHVLPIAEGRRKRSLFDRIVEERAEGIVFKHARAPYKAGRGSTQLKYKLTKSADVVLLSNAGNAYQMAVYDGKTLRDVGKVFAGTTNETRALIDRLLSRGEKPVAEVRYLYATDDDNLFQPVFVGLRDDKKATECTRAQLIRTARGIIAL
jgi:bifunctional non-homologous end joining protein LigD